MPPVKDDDIISELEEFEPSRVDGVGKGANGFPILMLKGIDDEIVETEATLDEVIAEVDKAVSDDREKCDACDGMAKSVEECKKCFGTGILPRLGETPAELVAAAKAMKTAASGAPVPHADVCPTCKGSKVVPTGADANHACPDCDGSGHDNTEPPSDALSRVDGDGHHIHEGDAKGREKVDKAVEVELCEDDDCEVCKEAFGEPEELEKAKLKAKARNALPEGDFALPGRRYPIHDASHARNALARVSQHGTPEEKATVRRKVHARYPDIAMAEKADATFSAPNPAMGVGTKVGGDDTESGPAPGSPEWEGIDAETAGNAACALMEAAELIRTFAQREAIEMVAGEGNDVFDTFVAEEALCHVGHALGIMAQMAFHEGREAAKSIDDEETAEKAGKRLSRKSVQSLASLRDHITNLLGDDDPTKPTTEDEDASKSIDMDALSKELEDMSTDEFTKVLDERDERLVSTLREMLSEDAEKGKSATDQAESVSSAKTANSKSKAKKPKAEMRDLEDEAAQSSDGSGTNQTHGHDDQPAAKAEGEVEAEVAVALTPEEVEADDAVKAAKKATKEAKKAKRAAAENAAIQKALEESRAEAEEAVKTLEQRLQETADRLATVEKMAAPGVAVRTAPIEAQKVESARTELEQRIAHVEHVARTTPDNDIRKAKREEAKELTEQLANL